MTTLGGMQVWVRRGSCVKSDLLSFHYQGRQVFPALLPAWGGALIVRNLESLIYTNDTMFTPNLEWTSLLTDTMLSTPHPTHNPPQSCAFALQRLPSHVVNYIWIVPIPILQLYFIYFYGSIFKVHILYGGVEHSEVVRHLSDSGRHWRVVPY